MHLYAQGWQPEPTPRAGVCLVHGLGDHSGRYGGLVSVLESGHMVVILRHHKHIRAKTPR